MVESGAKKRMKMWNLCLPEKPVKPGLPPPADDCYSFSHEINTNSPPYNTRYTLGAIAPQRFTMHHPRLGVRGEEVVAIVHANHHIPHVTHHFPCMLCMFRSQRKSNTMIMYLCGSGGDVPPLARHKMQHARDWKQPESGTQPVWFLAFKILFVEKVCSLSSRGSEYSVYTSLAIGHTG